MKRVGPTLKPTDLEILDKFPQENSVFVSTKLPSFKTDLYTENKDP